MTAEPVEVRFPAADGWGLAALVRLPTGASGSVPGVVSVPGSRHERDAWTQTSIALAHRGVGTLLLDIRGRGSSRGSCNYARLAPLQRRDVRLDVQAALEQLARTDGVDPHRLAVLTEQDTAADALEATIDDHRVRAVTLVSPRHPGRIARAQRRGAHPVHGLVSTEDHEGLRATVDAYLHAPEGPSQLDVYRGLGIGITMASVRQFEQPDEERLEDRIAHWLALRLA